MEDDIETRKRLNEVARRQQIIQLKRDILVDLQVSKLENWEYKTYIKEIRDFCNEILGE